KGKHAGLMEGKEKLEEGICPFFKEQCQNIVGKVPKDVFSEKVNELDKDSKDIDKNLEELGQEIKVAEKAGKQLDEIKVKSQEIEKQLSALSKKKEENNKRKTDIEKVRKKHEDAEKKTLDRKDDLEKYSKLDAEITKTEKLKTENQTARDAFFADKKDAKDLNNRREKCRN
ncbi:SMC family ATPase, partial [Thermodesulfobacteriota bacterium]